MGISKPELPQSLVFVSKLIAVLVLFQIAFQNQVVAAPIQRSPYQILKNKAETIEKAKVMDGWAYIVSGGIAVSISIPGYFLTQDIFARSVYSVGETLGVASVGYGSYLVLLQNDYLRFQKIIAESSLTPAQRDEISLRYLQENAEQAKASRKIRVITHSLTAGLNLLNGLTSSNPELRTALFFLSSINLLAAVHFLISKSEEEKFLDTLADDSPPKWDVIVSDREGPALAVQWRF